MKVEAVGLSEAVDVASVLQEAARWLIEAGKPLWSLEEFSEDGLRPDILRGEYFAAHLNGAIVGVMKFQLEDKIFWPEEESGASAFVHKLAVRRSHSGVGISTELLSFAKGRAQSLGLRQLRLDCLADRAKLRQLYEGFGFQLHSIVTKWNRSFARYELPLLPS
jgi:GNAT superfamily N-acetyltransferase